MELPSLKALRLELWEPDWSFHVIHPEVDDLEDEEDFKRLFFRGWKLPALKVFDLANQSQSHDIMQCSNLTCLHLNLGLNEMPGWDNSSRWSSQSLLGYLRAFVHSMTLEELTIKLSHVELSKSTFLEAVHLASVRKLSFDVEGLNPHYFVPLAEKLRFSGLKYMDLQIEIYYGNFEEWIAPFRDDTNYGGNNPRKRLCRDRPVLAVLPGPALSKTKG